MATTGRWNTQVPITTIKVPATDSYTKGQNLQPGGDYQYIPKPPPSVCSDSDD